MAAVGAASTKLHPCAGCEGLRGQPNRCQLLPDLLGVAERLSASGGDIASRCLDQDGEGCQVRPCRVHEASGGRLKPWPGYR